MSNNTFDLGSTNNKWKDLYLSGNLSDGTNSISVANIIAKQNALPTTSTAGKVLKSTSTSGTVEWGDAPSVPTMPATTTAGQLVKTTSTSGSFTSGNSLPYLTTAPSAANTDGGLILVVLSSEPATRYDGYIYIITSSNS